MDAETIQNHLNHPRNALNLQSDAHDIMDKYMGWGIEAIPSDDQVIFSFRLDCDLEFTYHIVEILLPNCSTRSIVRHYTAERW